MRNDLEQRMQGATDRDYAALVARYQSVLTDLGALPGKTDSDGIDDLAKRRKVRRATASSS